MTVLSVSFSKQSGPMPPKFTKKMYKQVQFSVGTSILSPNNEYTIRTLIPPLRVLPPINITAGGRKSYFIAEQTTVCMQVITIMV